MLSLLGEIVSILRLFYLQKGDSKLAKNDKIFELFTRVLHALNAFGSSKIVLKGSYHLQHGMYEGKQNVLADFKHVRQMNSVLK